ncbi:MAG: hypothetical protein SWQ30_17570, partial [Thermodesulfobacteriota bacterium]|nr:hypothetical protein [Thermodesulfobacteriota bacterium]
MKGKMFVLPAVVFIVIAAGFLGAPNSVIADNAGDFPDSLHWTLRGMPYWYDGDYGGLEQTTGIPYEMFTDSSSGCMNCHAKDPGDPDNPAVACVDSRCHGVYSPTGPPSGSASDIQTNCLACHGREKWMRIFDDNSGTPDVHRDGVNDVNAYCTDCHTSREMHDIGDPYVSLKEPGAMDTTCASCHTTGPGPVPGTSYSHDTHTASLDCTACHQRRVTSCYNCHVDTAYASGVRQAKAKLTDWLFLMNYDGKVHSANMQTFIGGDNDQKWPGETTNEIEGPFDETALMFAPVHSHSIMKPGRACADCHGSANAEDAYKNGELDLTWLDEYDALQHTMGVIPVGLKTSYNIVTFDKDNDITDPLTWYAMDDGGSQSADARYHIAFGSPLTPAQMGSLAYIADPTTSYPDSLHETLRGMEYWYETGDSLDDMTGADYDDFTHATAGCMNCHPTGTTSACEDARCHDGDSAPTGPPARTAAEIQIECLKCHGREGAMISYDGTTTPSVHRDGTGVTQYCTDCHSSREIHNVDTDYISLKEPGAMDTECANCHDPDIEGPGPVPPTDTLPAPTYATVDQRTYSHTFHTKTLDCNACHQQHVTTCYNCHMDTAIDTGPRKAKGKIQDWLFLMNYDGKVTSANIQTFVGGDNSLKHPEGYNTTWSENDEVALMFAPVHSHSLTKYGRVCADCHQNATVADILADGELDLTWDDSGSIGHVTGLIPVAEEATYNVVAYDKDNTLESGFTWYANTPGAADHRFEIAYGSGLTANQMARLGYTADPAAEYPTSFHNLLGGMPYWYETGDSLDDMTGIDYDLFTHPTKGCKNCHPKADDPGDTSACQDDRCHGGDVETPTTPPDLTASEIETNCLTCHGREKWMRIFDDNDGTPDVHRDGWNDENPYCTDCHSSREIHKVGSDYDSLKEPGAMDTECANCHDAGTGPLPPENYSHNTHTATLDCNACHQRRVVSCYNCHVDTAYENGNRVAKAKLTDWLFLINYDGKVTSGNMQTFVGGDNQQKHPEGWNTIDGANDEVALMFAPVHSHSIMKQGRACADCHRTDTVQELYAYGDMDLTWLDGDTLEHQMGVIPVAEDATYNVVAFDKDNTLDTGFTWYAMGTPPEAPDHQFEIAFGSALTADQMAKLNYAASEAFEDFEDGIHNTYRGMEYWYETGVSLDDIVGVDYDDFDHASQGCKNCHGGLPFDVNAGGQNCETCHGVGNTNPTGPPWVSDPDEIQPTCLACHAREKVMKAEDDAAGTPDVHRAKGMTCMECHSSREVHNIGTEYESHKDIGAMDTECADCHTTGPGTPQPDDYSHSVHTATVDCSACHQRRVISCYNCHMDTAVDGPMRMARTKIKDWLFLMNYDGKVTAANMQSFVGGDNSVTGGPNEEWSSDDGKVLMFAPMYSHSTMKEGRTCEDCHGTATVADIRDDSAMDLTTTPDGGTTIENPSGVIPVAAGTDYNLLWYDKDRTTTSSPTWWLLDTVPDVGDIDDLLICNGTALSSDQMDSLAMSGVGHGAHLNGAKGPELTSCTDCHLAEEGGGVMKDSEPLSTTNVCDACHSPGGAFNGVDSTGDSVGAKNNWDTGVYADDGTLQAGKEKWCAGCHDEMPASSQPTPPAPTSVVVDNPDATFTCTWGTSTVLPEQTYGSDFRYIAAGSTTDCEATFAPGLTTAGYYDVYAWWTSNTARATSV